MAIGQFGHRVIGKDQFKREEALLQRNALKYGPRVLGYRHDFVSIEKLKEVLEDNPYNVERFMVAEMHRPEGARREALELLLATEAGLDDPDLDQLARIEDELNKLSEPSPEPVAEQEPEAEPEVAEPAASFSLVEDDEDE